MPRKALLVAVDSSERGTLAATKLLPESGRAAKETEVFVGHWMGRCCSSTAKPRHVQLRELGIRIMLREWRRSAHSITNSRTFTSFEILRHDYPNADPPKTPTTSCPFHQFRSHIPPFPPIPMNPPSLSSSPCRDRTQPKRSPISSSHHHDPLRASSATAPSTQQGHNSCVAQRKRAGLITRRSLDRNESQLIA